ncbi:FtsJ methyltransferase domain-containing protein 2, partial [Coelomomyces lativittatus]
KSLGSFTSFQLHQARLASNPYDHIDTHPFLNRAALKLAEIDHVFPLMLPPTLSNEVAFLDLACGPGGFTEYLLWKYPEVHGIGTSLPTKDHRDFYPHLFLPSVHVDHRFTYLPGDLCDLEHRSFLLTYLQTHVHEQKVLLVTADGGMDVVGQEHIQEHLHLPLMLAQLHVAFQSLREHGKLVWKIYDVTTPCMMSLLTCVAMHFRSFTLWKPTTSRPANSERYVLADGFLSLPQHYALPNWTSPVSPMTGWIAPPPSLLKFLFRINVRHHQRQYHALVRLKAFLEHPELKHMEPDPREKIEVFLKPFHFPKGLSRKTRKTA